MNTNYIKKITTVILLILTVLSCLHLSPTNASITTPIQAEITIGRGTSIQADYIYNIPITWQQFYGLGIGNAIGSETIVYNPKYQLKTDRNFVSFFPNDPKIFTSNPPDYTWNFAGLQIKEAQRLTVDLLQENIIMKPGFSAKRTVEPETLTEPITIQTVTLDFKLEEPLAPEVQSLNIMVNGYINAYLPYKVVDTTVISQNTIDGWNTYNDGKEATWSINADALEIGKTYSFIAVISSIKSSELSGSPTFKPGVGIFYGRWIDGGAFTGNSATITTPDNSITCTYTADNSLNWHTSVSDNRLDFWFAEQASSIIPNPQPPPSYAVKIPATVNLTPDSYNIERHSGEMTAYIQLPQGYSANNIDRSSIKLNGLLSASLKPSAIGDYNSDGISDLMVKFHIPTIGQLPDKFTYITVELGGQLTDGTLFAGTDYIKIISN